jgi:hypothetical protein
MPAIGAFINARQGAGRPVSHWAGCAISSCLRNARPNGHGGVRIGPQLTAVAKGQKNPNGYTYALANQHYPETLTIWHNGRVVLKSLANTGIPASPTVDGTFPVYLRYYFSHMKGTNPDGSKYDDRCTTRPTSTAATRCTSSAGGATGRTRAWAASSCPGPRPRRRGRT